MGKLAKLHSRGARQFMVMVVMIVALAVGNFAYMAKSNAAAYCGNWFQVNRTVVIYDANWRYYKTKYAGDWLQGRGNSSGTWQTVCFGGACTGVYGYVERAAVSLKYGSAGTCG